MATQRPITDVTTLAELADLWLRQLRAAADSVEFRGEPIVYALTIPTAAPHPHTARAFVRFVFSPEGQAILGDNGFMLLDKPLLGGPGRPPAGLF